MSQQIDSGYKGFIASAAIAAGILVKKVNGKVAVAGLAEEPIGVTTHATFADGDPVAVKLLSASGTLKCVAANAVADGAVVYGRALGKVDDVSSSSAIRVGIALEAASATGDFIEVVPC